MIISFSFLGLMNISSDVGDPEDGQKCFKHAVKSIIYRKDLYCEIKKKYQDKCEKCFGEKKLCTICDKEISNEFKIKCKKSISYTHFEGRFNFGKIQFPAGLREIKTLEKINPKAKFRVYQYCEEDFIEIYYTEQTNFHVENSQSIQFIDLALASSINYESMESFSHFFPIINLTTFLRKVYKVVY